jgi:cob(I)alamin adenosyltransferase
LAKAALDFAAKVMQEKKPHLLVLDEVGLATQWKMLDVKEVLRVLEKVPAETTVVMTGRLAPKELVDRADFVNEVKLVKMPEKFELTEGIQY